MGLLLCVSWCFLMFGARCDAVFVCVNSVVFAVILLSCGIGLMWVGLVWRLLWVVFVRLLFTDLFDVDYLVLLLFTCLWLC